MSVFSDAEINYLQSQRLARIATAGRDSQPHVVPVSFRYNPQTDTIDVGGHGFAERKKYRARIADARIAEAPSSRSGRRSSAGRLGWFRILSRLGAMVTMLSIG